jgi:hypothetical protein
MSVPHISHTESPAVFRKVQVTQAHPGGTLEAVAAAAEEEDSREQTSQTDLSSISNRRQTQNCGKKQASADQHIYHKLA